MSWHIPVFVIPAGSKNFSEMIDAQEVQGQADVPDAAEAAQAAKEAAKTLISSGVLGRWQGNNFRVALSGHANPGNVAPPGWSDDFINISISQTSRNTDGTPIE